MPRTALIEMLRLYVPAVNKHVYPPDVQPSATMPRITVNALTPTEQRVAIGEQFGSYKGLFYLYTFRVDVWDRKPGSVETTCDQVMYAIRKHRQYVPASPNNVYGEFLFLETAGGSDTSVDAPRQLYRRTINVHGKWLARAQENW